MRGRSRLKPWLALLATLVVASSLIALSVAAVLPIGRRLATDSVSTTLPHPVLRALSLRSVVYDAEGAPIATLSGPEDRAFTQLRDMSPVLRKAVLAAEDREFYQHGGIDWRGVTRALSKNLNAGTITQGGSTITQQLVKNTMFTDPHRDIARKIKEAVLAIALEQEYTKDQIFEQYLNTVYFGNGAYGVRTASERYFGTGPRHLRVDQAALLAALIASPSGRDPMKHPDEAARWRNHVVDEMAKAGWIDPRQAATARRAPLPTTLHFDNPNGMTDPFVEEVKRQLLGDPRIGATPQQRYQRVFEGGLRIFTTFDPRLQALASIAATKLPPGTGNTVAMVVVDNSNGAVRAIVPGDTFTHAGFDLATQGHRQAGSAFKAITVAAAIDNGFSPYDTVDASGQCTLNYAPNMPPWDLHNYEGESFGTLTFVQALAKSSNCAFARIALALGPEKIVEMAHRLGIERPLEAVPSITLGTEEVSPLEMAGAFSTLAADGVRHPTHFIDRVETRDGKVVFRNNDPGSQAVPPQVARTATDMLTHVVTEGTAANALSGFGRPAAGKTGTNDASRDVWFVGYTPQLTAAVWIGNPLGQIPVIIDGVSQVGGNYPARIWRDFMAAALANVPPTDFIAPDRSLWPPGGRISEFGRSKYVPPPPRPAPAPQPTTPAPQATTSGTNAPTGGPRQTNPAGGGKHNGHRGKTKGGG